MIVSEYISIYGIGLLEQYPTTWSLKDKIITVAEFMQANPKFELEELIRETIVEILSEVDIDKTAGSVQVKKGTPQASAPELKKLTSQGVDVTIVPEAKDGGLISKIQTGDIILMNAITGELKCMDQQVNNRDVRMKDNSNVFGLGRELFFNMRTQVSSSEEGASFL